MERNDARGNSLAFVRPLPGHELPGAADDGSREGAALGSGQGVGNHRRKKPLTRAGVCSSVMRIKRKEAMQDEVQVSEVRAGVAERG